MELSFLIMKNVMTWKMKDAICVNICVKNHAIFALKEDVINVNKDGI